MTNGDLPSRPGKDPEFQNVVVQLTGAERALALAGLIVILVVLLLGDVILNDYSISHSTWLIALAMLATIYFFYAGERSHWHDWYPWLAEIGGWALALNGIVDLLDRVFGSTSTSGATVIFQVAFYVAAALAGFGAFQIRRQG